MNMDTPEEIPEVESGAEPEVEEAVPSEEVQHARDWLFHRGELDVLISKFREDMLEIEVAGVPDPKAAKKLVKGFKRDLAKLVKGLPKE